MSATVKLISFSDDNTTQIVQTVPIEPGETAATFKRRHVEPGNSLWRVVDIPIDVNVLDSVIEQGGELLCVQQAEDGTYEKYLYKVSREKA